MDEPKVVFKDRNFLAICKPAGFLVHKAKNRKEQTLVDWMLKRYPEIKNVGDLPVGRQATQLRPGIVHRLDKDTSGVIVVARN